MKKQVSEVQATQPMRKFVAYRTMRRAVRHYHSLSSWDRGSWQIVTPYTFFRAHPKKAVFKDETCSQILVEYCICTRQCSGGK